MRKGKFEIYTGKDGKVRFHLKSPAGHIVLDGRAYASKSEAIHGIASVMRYGEHEAYFIRRESLNGQFFFQIKSPAGRLLGWSRFYTNRKARERDIETTKAAVKMGRVFEIN